MTPQGPLHPDSDEDGHAPLADASPWPPHAPPDPAEAVRSNCEACGKRWLTDRRMAGSRFRCTCGGWVQVAAASRAIAWPESSSPAARLLPGAGGDAPLAPKPREFAVVRGWDGGEIRPSSSGEWTLEQASVADQARWTNRTILEIAALVLALIVPGAVVQLLVSGPREALWIPVASAVGGLGVIVISAKTRPSAFAALRGAAPKWFGIGALYALATAALAVVVWRSVTKQDTDPDFVELRHWIGMPGILFVIGFCPAVFEELAFRGVLHERLTRLHGTRAAVWWGSTLFGLCHGIQMGLPFQWGLGLFVSWLRVRSDSLLPGIFVHALYNAAIAFAIT